MKRVDEPIMDWLMKCKPIWGIRGDAKSMVHTMVILYGIWERTDTDLDFVEWWDKLLRDAFPERSYNHYDKRFE